MDATLQTRRLVVLVPDYRENCLDLAHKIFMLASQAQCGVLYLTLAQPEEDNLALARAMATLSAQTSGPWLEVQWQHARAGGWLEALQDACRPGDRIICHAGQAVTRRYGLTGPLCEQIRASLGLPVQVLSGFHQPVAPRSVLRQMHPAAWLGLALILALFAWLELELDLAAGGTLGRLMVMIVVLLEFSVVLAWNHIS